MTLSACIWAVSGPEARVLAQIADAGFTHVDIRPGWLASEPLRERVRDLGLTVSCIAASAGMPEGASLADPDAAARAFDHIERALEHGASTGCTAAGSFAGLRPGFRASTIPRSLQIEAGTSSCPAAQRKQRRIRRTLALVYVLV